MFNSATVRVEIDRRCPIKDNKITGFFQDYETEILGSMEDRDFVRWIWCKSLKPKKLKQSKYRRVPFSHQIEESLQCINKMGLDLDSDQLKKETVGKCFYHCSLIR